MSKPIYRLVETAPPATEPVTVAEMKDFLRLSTDGDNDLLAGLIAAARQMCENATGCALVTRGYSLYLDRWPSQADRAWWDGLREGADILSPSTAIDLPHPPLAAIDSVMVYAADNTSAVFGASSYIADIAGGRMVLAGAPPTAGRAVNGIEVRYSAGYGGAADVPAVFRQALKMIAAYLYEHRGADTGQALSASGARSLLQPYRVMDLA